MNGAMGMHIVLTLCGVVIGFIAVVLGDGGGGLYVGLLATVFDVRPTVAVSTSLATIVPTVLIGSYSHWRAGNVRFRLGWPVLVGGGVGAAIGGALAPMLPAELYLRGLGVLILVMLLLILWHPPEPRDARSRASAIVGACFGVVGGTLSGIAGISGSLPILVGLLLLGCTAIEAIGTSVFVLIGVSVSGFLAHLHGGDIDWPLVGWLGAGTTAGAFLAPLALARLDKERLERVFKPLVIGISAVMGTVMLVAPHGW